MHNIFTILKKELKAYFYSPIAYIFLTLFLGLSSWLYLNTLFESGQTDIRMYFFYYPWIFLFFIPALAMRLWSEEKNTGTIELLMSFPARTYELVLGKFFAGVAFLVMAFVLSLTVAFSVSSIGSLDWGPVISSYVGATLIGASFLSLGGFMSALTRNQIIAFLITVVTAFILFLAGTPFLLKMLPASIVPFVQFLGLGGHFDTISKGVIDSRDVIYYVSFMVFMLYLNTAAIENQRWKHKLGSSLVAVILLIALAFINIISVKVFIRTDLTEDKLYTVSDSTKKILANLDDIVNIKAFFSDNFPEQITHIRRQIEDTLNEYRAYSGNKIQIEYIDPLTDEETEKKAMDLQIQPQTPQVRQKAEVKAVKLYFGLAVFYTDKHEVIPFINPSTFEYELTSAIVKVSAEKERTVGFLTGHTEPDMQKDLGAVCDALSRQMKVEPVEIKSGTPIDKTLSALVIASPANITDTDKFAIDQYIMSGGKVLFFVNAVQVPEDMPYGTPRKHNLGDLLEHYGVKINTDVIADYEYQGQVQTRQGNFVMSQPYVYFVVAVNKNMNHDHPVTNKMNEVIFPWVSSVELVQGKLAGKKAVELVKTSTNSSAASVSNGVDLQPKMEMPQGSNFSQYTIAVAVTGEFDSFYANKPIPMPPPPKEGEGPPPPPSDPNSIIKKSPETAIVVVGDSDFITDNFGGRSKSNQIFFQNLIDWLTMGEDLIKIRSRETAARPIEEVSDSKKFFLKAASIAGMPLLVIIFGITLALVRRAKRYSMM
ncbi:MAG: Gldg family protein [Planctomycetes bacterium]|nr:Gldg family protein [Planctomycetota bacterium]